MISKTNKLIGREYYEFRSTIDEYKRISYFQIKIGDVVAFAKNMVSLDVIQNRPRIDNSHFVGGQLLRVEIT